MHMAFDSAVTHAFSRALDHEPPFSVEELQSVTDLHVRNARDLRGIDQCQSLEILILVGCDPVSLDPFQDLKSLRSLTIRDSGLTDISGITRLSLLSFDAPRNFIEDISEMIHHPRLLSINVTGNPLSENSYRTIIPALREKGRRVTFSGELEWSLTTRMKSAGVPVSCYRDDRGYRLSRPGLTLTGAPEYGHPVIPEEDVRALLEGDDPRKALEYFEREELVPFSPKAQ